jgi:hypothetical protein
VPKKTLISPIWSNLLIVLNSLYQPRWISRHNAVVLHVARYHRACSNDGILAYGHARQNRRSRTDPAVTLQVYGLARQNGVVI